MRILFWRRPPPPPPTFVEKARDTIVQSGHSSIEALGTAANWTGQNAVKTARVVGRGAAVVGRGTIGLAAAPFRGAKRWLYRLYFGVASLLVLGIIFLLLLKSSLLTGILNSALR